MAERQGELWLVCRINKKFKIKKIKKESFTKKTLKLRSLIKEMEVGFLLCNENLIYFNYCD